MRIQAGQEPAIIGHRVDIKAQNEEYHFVIKEDEHGIRLIAVKGRLIIQPDGTNAVVIKEESY